MPEVLLGLDFGSRRIKAAIVKVGKKAQIISATVLNMPDGSVVDGVLTNPDAAAESIQTYISGSGVKLTGLAVCVSSPDIITRNLTLPQLNASEIPSAVRFEIFKLFPSIKDTHVVTQKVISSNASNTVVLAALCPSALLKAYRNLASRLELPLKYADVRENAQAKAVNYFVGADSEAGILIDIGYQSSHVGVINRGRLVLSRFVMSGAAAYDAMASGKANVSRNDIEDARVSGDFSKVRMDPYVTESVLSMCFSEIDDQIRQAVDLYSNEKYKEKLAYVTVVGEGGSIPGIERHFAALHNLKMRDIAQSDGGGTDKGARGAGADESTGGGGAGAGGDSDGAGSSGGGAGAGGDGSSGGGAAGSDEGGTGAGGDGIDRGARGAGAGGEGGAGAGGEGDGAGSSGGGAAGSGEGGARDAGASGGGAGAGAGAGNFGFGAGVDGYGGGYSAGGGPGGYDASGYGTGGYSAAGSTNVAGGGPGSYDASGFSAAGYSAAGSTNVAGGGPGGYDASGFGTGGYSAAGSAGIAGGGAGDDGLAPLAKGEMAPATSPPLPKGGWRQQDLGRQGGFTVGSQGGFSVGSQGGLVHGDGYSVGGDSGGYGAGGYGVGGYSADGSTNVAGGSPGGYGTGGYSAAGSVGGGPGSYGANGDVTGAGTRSDPELYTGTGAAPGAGSLGKLNKGGNMKLLLSAAGVTLGGVTGAAGIACATGSTFGGVCIDMNFTPSASVGAGGRGASAVRRMAIALSAALLIAIVAVSVRVYLYTERMNYLDEMTQIDSEMFSDKQVNELSAAKAQASAKLSDYASVIDSIDAQSAKVSSLLDELAAQIPEGLFVINFSTLDSDGIVISGKSRDYDCISEFALLLRQTDMYDSVRINSITANQTASDAFLDYSFTMTILLKPAA